MMEAAAWEVGITPIRARRPGATVEAGTRHMRSAYRRFGGRLSYSKISRSLLLGWEWNFFLIQTFLDFFGKVKLYFPVIR